MHKGKQRLKRHNDKSAFKRSTWVSSSHSANMERGKRYLRKAGYKLTTANNGYFTDQVEFEDGEIIILYTSVDTYKALFKAGIIAWELHGFSYDY
jgi:hypothetical protein